MLHIIYHQRSPLTPFSSVTFVYYRYFDNNPWRCDCDLVWFIERVQTDNLGVEDYQLIMCASPQQVNMSDFRTDLLDCNPTTKLQECKCMSYV